MTTASRAVLHHPGPRHPDRRQTVGTFSAAASATLRAGIRLIDALDEVVASTGSDCAQIELMGGTFDRISYCVPACGTGNKPVQYSETREATVPAQLLSASVTFGYRDGQRFTHCHALWLEANGELRGGHLWPESTIGAVPPHAVVHTLPGVTMISDHDCETLMPVFTPSTGEVVPQGEHQVRALISRVLPGEDLLEAAEKICHTHHIERALIRASLGSVIGACLKRPDSDLLVDGPATEIIALSGAVRPGATGSIQASASAIVVDRHGEVHTGELVHGHNPVAITFELLIVDQA